MLPTREEALKLIRDGLLFNPGPWGKHCLTAAGVVSGFIFGLIIFLIR